MKVETRKEFHTCCPHYKEPFHQGSFLRSKHIDWMQRTSCNVFVFQRSKSSYRNHHLADSTHRNSDPAYRSVAVMRGVILTWISSLSLPFRQLPNWPLLRHTEVPFSNLQHPEFGSDAHDVQEETLLQSVWDQARVTTQTTKNSFPHTLNIFAQCFTKNSVT